MGRPKSERWKRVEFWATHYGVSPETVNRMDVERLDRMAGHARDTLFAALQWDRQHPGWRRAARLAGKENV